MSEFIEAILSPSNFILTVLLGCFLLYWSVVIFGVLDMDALDVDLDVDLDFDADVNTGGHVHAGGFFGFLKFLNVGEVPLMVLLTTFTLVLWLIGVLSHMLVGEWSVAVQFLSLIPFAVVSALLTKVLTHPAKKLFAQLERDATAGSVEVLGQRCRVISATADHRHGQAEIETGAAPVKINVRTPSSEIVLARGSEAVVVTDRDSKGVYVIRGF